MNKSSFWTRILGVMLLLMGGILVAQTFGYLSGTVLEVFFTAFFAIGGILFFVLLFQDRSRWWAVIPGFTLLGIAGTIAMAEMLPSAYQGYAGAVILGSIGLSFLAVFLMRTGFWWALIPAFIMLALSGVVILEETPLGVLSEMAGALFLGGVGLAFLVVFIAKRKFWWALIPGFVMLGLGVMVALVEGSFGINDEQATGIFLASIGLAFLAVYVVRRDFWWAIIPFGSMLGVALLVAFGNVAYLFFGLALTFALLGVIPVDGKRMSWPWIPSLVLLIIGAIFYLAMGAFSGYVLPAFLILAGLFLIYRGFFNR
jgi:hypothetical protein